MINRNKTQRIYREEGLAVRQRRSRRRALTLERRRRLRFWPCRTSVGALTLCMISWRQAGGSAWSTSLMT